MGIQYKKTRQKTAKKDVSKTASKTKSAKPARKTKTYTKRQVEDYLHSSRIAMLGLLLLASFALVINISLIVTGGWDDVIIGLLAAAPLLAGFAALSTWHTYQKMHRRRREFVISFVVFLLFSVAFLTVTAVISVKSLVQYYTVSHESSIVGMYKCASTENNRERGIYDVHFVLGAKEYAFEDYRSDAAVIGSYEAEKVDDEYVLKALIKKNTQGDSLLGFEETSYTVKLEDDNKMRLSMNSSGGLRFCTRE